MDNGAKRAFRYAKEGAPDPIAGVKDAEGMGGRKSGTNPGRTRLTDLSQSPSRKSGGRHHRKEIAGGRVGNQTQQSGRTGRMADPGTQGDSSGALG
eukprot:10480232-Heterocapsa_arctica.AAC.1